MQRDAIVLDGNKKGGKLSRSNYVKAWNYNTNMNNM